MTPPHLSPILDDATLKRLALELAPIVAAASPNGNGSLKADWLRYLIGLALAAVVAYFTTVSATKEQIAAIKATEESHFGEVLRRLDVMQADIRDLRAK